MPTIPKGLKPVVENYGIGAPDGVMRTDVAGGLARYGMEWDRGVQQYRVTLILTSLQMSVWTTFFHHAVKKGSIAFDMDLDSGYGMQAHSVNVVPDSYAAAPSGGRSVWTVSFVVEAESTTYAMSDDDAQALLDLYDQQGDDSAALLQAIDQFANHDTLVLQ